MLCDIVLLREKWAYTAQLQDAHAAIHDCQFIHAHQAFAKLLIIQGMGYLTATVFTGVVGIYCFFAQGFFHALQRGLFLAAQE